MRKFLPRRTPFELFIFIILISSGIAVWAAYQPTAAWKKFGLIIISILIYYLLTVQSVDRLWTASIVLCLLGFSASIYFFISNDWYMQLHKFEIISKIGIAWQQIRPNLQLVSIHPNDIAGIAGLVLPFALTLAIEYQRRRSVYKTVIFSLITILILTAIVLSSSRGAWMALGITGGLWIIWVMINQVGFRNDTAKKFLYLSLIGVILCLVIAFSWKVMSDRITELMIGRPDVSVSDQRYHIFLSDIEIIKDVPFTGGGLDSFSGYYSNYIMINPNYILGYGHNIFLDGAIQMGFLGGLALVWIYLGSIVLLFFYYSQSQSYSLLRIAILSSLCIIVFHSLVDDLLFRSYYVPLLFVIPGMAVGLHNASVTRLVRSGYNRPIWERIAIFISVCIILLGVIIFRNSILSAWYTNLGVVEMAKSELSDFPTGSWNVENHLDEFTPAEIFFDRALNYNPLNSHANYRMGLIAMLKRDFPSAIDHLEIAHQGDPYHRGMLKALGLSYVWNGQLENAIPLLSQLPESDQELSIYPWWWREQGRPDLAFYAEQYLELTESKQ